MQIAVFRAPLFGPYRGQGRRSIVVNGDVGVWKVVLVIAVYSFPLVVLLMAWL